MVTVQLELAFLLSVAILGTKFTLALPDLSWRGVREQDRPIYESQLNIEAQSGEEYFRCFADGRLIPRSAFNDDYCDCADASDEPGTAACSFSPLAVFHCRNQGHEAKFISASLVDDGVCDCCDGSDEIGLVKRGGGRCVNSCAQERQATLAIRKEEYQSMLAGIAAKVKIAEQGSKLMRNSGQTIRDLEATLEKLTGRRSEVADELVKLQKEKEELKLQKNSTTTTDAPGLDEDSSVDDGEFESDEAEQGHEETGGSELLPTSRGKLSAWLSKLRSAVLTILKRSKSSASLEAEEDWSLKQVEEAIQGARKEKSNLVSQISNAERELADLKAKVAFEYDIEEDRNAAVQLYKEHYTFSFDKLTYTVYLFDKAEQKESHRRYDLGRYSSTVRISDSTLLMRFENGSVCPNGATRSLTITVSCGDPSAILQVSEPQSCIYVAQMRSPLACPDALPKFDDYVKRLQLQHVDPRVEKLRGAAPRDPLARQQHKEELLR